MAELPRFQRSTGIPGGIGGDRASPAQTGAGAFARTLEQAGGGLLDVGEALDRIQQTRESAWITRTTGEANVHAAELEARLEAEAGDDAPDHVGRFRGEFGAFKNKALSAAPSKRARRALEARLSHIEASAIRRRGAFQARAQLAKREQDFATGLNAHLATVRAAPERLPEVLPVLRDDVAGAAPWLANTLEGDDKRQALTAYARQLDAQAIEEAALGFADGGDFDSAREMVRQLREMAMEDRAIGVDMAINHIEDQEIRQDDGMDFQRLREAKESEAIGLVAEGGLTRDWVEANGPIVSDGMEASLRRALDVRNPETQPALYTDLLGRALEPGAPQEALAALGSGALTQQDFATIYNASRVGGVAAHFRGQIARELKPAQFDDGAAYVAALTEYDAWAAQNPGATKDQARQMADRVIGEGKQRMFDDKRATLPVPMFLPDARSAITSEAVKGAANRLAGAFRAGRLSPEQAAAEARKLMQWSDLLESQNGL